MHHGSRRHPIPLGDARVRVVRGRPGLRARSDRRLDGRLGDPCPWSARIDPDRSLGPEEAGHRHGRRDRRRVADLEGGRRPAVAAAPSGVLAVPRRPLGSHGAPSRRSDSAGPPRAHAGRHRPRDGPSGQRGVGRRAERRGSPDGVHRPPGRPPARPASGGDRDGRSGEGHRRLSGPARIVRHRHCEAWDCDEVPERFGVPVHALQSGVAPQGRPCRVAPSRHYVVAHRSPSGCVAPPRSLDEQPAAVARRRDADAADPPPGVSARRPPRACEESRAFRRSYGGALTAPTPSPVAMPTRRSPW